MEIQAGPAVFDQQLLNCIGDGVVITDRRGCIVYSNQVAADIARLAIPAMLGQYFSEVYPICDLVTNALLADSIQAAISREENIGLQKNAGLIRADNSKCYLSATCSPLCNDSGGITGCIAILRDITHLRTLELQVDCESQSLRRLFQASPVGMMIMDAHGGIRDVNDAALALLAADKNAVLGKQFGDAFCCCESVANDCGCGQGLACRTCLIRNTLLQAMQQGRTVKCMEAAMHFRRNRQETVCWLRLVVSPVHFGNNESFVLTMIDITDRKKKELAVKKSLDFYLRMLENFPGIVWWMKGYRLIYANGQCEEFLGIPQNEFAGRHWLQWVHPEDIGHYSKLFRLQREFECELRIRHRSGNYRWMLCVTRPFYDVFGKVDGMIGAAFDIHERKAIEEELRNAKKAAEEASLVKSSFLANMSHEIRTPINGMVGMIDLTLMTDLQVSQRENLVIAKDCAQSLLALINDILDFSKLEAGKMLLNQIVFDLYRMLENLLALYTLEAKKKGLELSCTWGDQVPQYIISDPIRLQQILGNLISNAIKFTEAGRIQVTINCRDTSAGKKICFAVCDTGIGIAATDMEKLFKSFSQIDGSMTRKVGGTGLGLMISKQLVEMMGGSISVVSTKNQGSEFLFSIICQEGDAQALAARSDENIVDYRQKCEILHEVQTANLLEETLDITDVLAYCQERAASEEKAELDFDTIAERLAVAEKIQKLKQLVANRDYEGIEYQARSLRDKARTLNKSKIHDILFKLQLAARREDIEKINFYMEEFFREPEVISVSAEGGKNHANIDRRR